jgi:diadenosine tetraphosphate (Ap4A) HIT family hydrolase
MNTADVPGCLGCDLLGGRRPLPGGVIYETAHWVVNRVFGPLNLGTLVVGPRHHVVAVSDLADDAAQELGPLLRRCARLLEALCEPEQVYVCLWSHGESKERKHLHFVVQPVTSEVVSEYGGLRSEMLQATMMRTGTAPPVADVEAFCDKARDWFREHGAE